MEDEAGSNKRARSPGRVIAGSGVFEAADRSAHGLIAPSSPIAWALGPAIDPRPEAWPVDVERRAVRSVVAARSGILTARGSVGAVVEARDVQEAEQIVRELRACSRWMPVLLFCPDPSAVFRGEAADRGVRCERGTPDGAAGRGIVIDFLDEQKAALRRDLRAADAFAARWHLTTTQAECVWRLVLGIRPGAHLDEAMNIGAETRKSHISEVRTKTSMIELDGIARAARGRPAW